MKNIVLLLLSCYVLNGSAQHSFYSLLPEGAYQVGFFDTLLLNQEQNYQQYSYSGAAPIFLQIWHPIDPSIKGKTLSYGDFRNRNLSKPLSIVYDSLCKQMDKSFIDYNILIDLINYQAIDYSPASPQRVLDTLKTFSTRSIYYPLKKVDYPVILYHHGAQGLSDENFIMAEYFASKGYIFVAANYHLPFEGLPYAHTQGAYNSLSFPKTVNQFIKQLSNEQAIFYIGHSWGAQNGFRYLYEEAWAKAFVSLETTLEFRKDTTKLKEIWPDLYQLLSVKKQQYALPILMIANTKEDKAFDFFKQLGTQACYFASAKEEFSHESYTSAFLLRNLYNKRFPQPDAVPMQRQLQLYVRHLQLIEAFLLSVRERKELETAPFSNDFFIHKD